mmetsp:Transcript_1461/g.4497  ORF Transcript_1461/g.4497 Transcript_1461/m.4497 type:complete len:219 (-) Transcript_1461:201-857(-)
MDSSRAPRQPSSAPSARLSRAFPKPPARALVAPRSLHPRSAQTSCYSPCTHARNTLWSNPAWLKSSKSSPTFAPASLQTTSRIHPRTTCPRRTLFPPPRSDTPRARACAPASRAPRNARPRRAPRRLRARRRRRVPPVSYDFRLRAPARTREVRETSRATPRTPQRGRGASACRARSRASILWQPTRARCRRNRARRRAPRRPTRRSAARSHSCHRAR